MNGLIKSSQALFSLLGALHSLNKLQYLVKKKKGKQQFLPLTLAK
jgi:hypothetical protein